MSLTYAIGDIHGALHKLRNLAARCEAHADGRPMQFVFLGDYVDRGPDTRGVIDCLMALAARTPDGAVTLRGNHEAMLLAAVDDAASEKHWLTQGGAMTLQSYNIANARDLPRQHVDWLRRLRLTHDDGRRFFVHAGIDPDRPLDAQDESDLLWMREPFLSDSRDHGRLIVHGHTPVLDRTPDVRANRVNLDTGAVLGGPLTAAVFCEAATPPIAFVQAE